MKQSFIVSWDVCDVILVSTLPMSEIQLYATKNLFPVAPHHSYGCETLVLDLPEFDYSVAADHVRSHSA